MRGRRHPLTHLLALASITLGACGDPAAQPCCPSLVLISIDSLRADRLGCYGADRSTSPFIDELAAQGILFESAMAPTPWTLPSHVTLLTGLSLPGHRVSDPSQRIDPLRRLLAQHLIDHGYRTAAFVSSPFLDRAYGFDRGFEVYQNFASGDKETIPPPQETVTASHTDETGARVIDAALAWLRAFDAGSSRGEPFFLFVHLWDVHYDYAPPAPFDRMFAPDYDGSLDPRDFIHNPAIHDGMPDADLQYVKDLYDGEIRWLDTQVGRLLTELDPRRARPTIVTLVADHGDEFFEHGHKGHLKALFEESVRVPWMLRFPGVVPGGQRVSGAASLEDVAPTLLSLMGLPQLPEATGRDLSHSARTGDPVVGPALLNFQGRVALRDASWKLIANRKTQHIAHYDLELDPGEQRPANDHPETRKRLQMLMHRLAAARDHARSLEWTETGPVELDPGTVQRLRSLGYLKGDEPAATSQAE